MWLGFGLNLGSTIVEETSMIVLDINLWSIYGGCGEQSGAIENINARVIEKIR